MDLRKLDTAPASEEGRFLHLRKFSSDGELLYTEAAPGRPAEPIGFLLRGVRSEHYKKREAEINKKRLDRLSVSGGRRVRFNNNLDDIVAEQRELHASLVIEARNIVLDGEQFPAKPEISKLLGLFNEFPWIALQIQEFVDDEANWLGES